MDRTLCDNLIRLADVPAIVPPRNGKPIHRSSVFRWAKTGINGHRLQVVRVGGALATTAEWLEQFFIELVEGPSQRPATSRQRQAEINAAKHRNDAAGL